MFDYDQNAPLGIEEVSSEKRGDVTVKDITYPSPVDGEPIAAYLVLPAGDGSFPGVLYVHWYEPSSPTSNRTQFLDEAVTLAGDERAVSLLVATMWSDPAWYNEGRSLDSDYDDSIQQVVELRRGLDVLLAQPQVDAERVAYVGHDFGAMYGAMLAGVDHRAIAYTFIAGASDFNEWMLFGVDENAPGLDDYKARMETIAPTLFIAHADPAAVLFQFGNEDVYTTPDDIAAFLGAVPRPVEIKVYDAEHAMTLPQIQADRLTFLRAQLGLTES